MTGIAMNESWEMLKNYLLGWNAYNARLFSVSERYFERVISNHKFEKFMPPYLKALVLFHFADTELSLGKIDKAKEYALQAVKQNHDLDKPFDDWPGYEIRHNIPPNTTDRISYPYRLLGDIYMKLGEFEMAKEAYKNALAITAVNFRAIRGIRLAEISLKPEVNLRITKQSFIQTLTQNSPWRSSWKLAEGITKKFNSGTFEMSFSYSPKDETLSGQFFNSSMGVRDGALRDFVVQNNCVSFIFTVSGNHYDFCLTKSGLLTGVISGFPNSDNLLADVVATPKK